MQNTHPLNQIHELAHIARPGMFLQLTNRFFCEGEPIGTQLLNLMADQKGDVGPAIAKRRRFDGEDVKAVEEILAKLLLGYERL